MSSRQQGVGSEASAAVSGQKKAVSRLGRLCIVSSGHQAAVGISEQSVCSRMSRSDWRS